MQANDGAKLSFWAKMKKIKNAFSCIDPNQLYYDL